MRLAEQERLSALARESIRIGSADNSGGANLAAKVLSLVGSMCAAADSINDADRLRHAAMDQLFGGVRACASRVSPVRTWNPCGLPSAMSR